MPQRSLLGGNVVSANTTALSDLAAKLRAVRPAAEERLEANLHDAGELVSESAKRRSGYSSHVPDSIHVDVAGASMVRVSTQLREAVAIENGGRGHVRHPVFVPESELPGPPGSWTSKNSHPAFLYPSLKAKRAAIYQLVVKTIHDAWTAAGLGGTD